MQSTTGSKVPDLINGTMLMGGGMLERVDGLSSGGGPTQPESGWPLQSVDRIRNVFPETWLWNNSTTGYFT